MIIETIICHSVLVVTMNPCRTFICKTLTKHNCCKCDIIMKTKRRFSMWWRKLLSCRNYHEIIFPCLSLWELGRGSWSKDFAGFTLINSLIWSSGEWRILWTSTAMKWLKSTLSSEWLVLFRTYHLDIQSQSVQCEFFYFFFFWVTFWTRSC